MTKYKDLILDDWLRVEGHTEDDAELNESKLEYAKRDVNSLLVMKTKRAEIVQSITSDWEVTLEEANGLVYTDKKMSLAQIKKAVAKIQEVLKSGCYEAIELAKTLFPQPLFAHREIMAKPFGKGAIKVSVFEKGRTTVFVNCSEDGDDEVVITTTGIDAKNYEYSL